MALFAQTTSWSVGYFQNLARFVLRQRRSIAPRLAYMNAEIRRIGEVTVIYGTDSEGQPTEERVGFVVTPGSSLEKLVRAYIAQGGNPYDISPFLMPDTTTEGVSRYPGGGVAAPNSVDINDRSTSTNTGMGLYGGGYVSLESYQPGRMGGKLNQGEWDHATIHHTIFGIRRPFEKEILHLQRLGERVIKLCDLREQLLQERDDDLVAAFGGTLEALDSFDVDRFVASQRVASLLDGVFRTLFDTYESGAPVNIHGKGDLGLQGFTFYSTFAESMRDGSS